MNRWTTDIHIAALVIMEMHFYFITSKYSEYTKFKHGELSTGIVNPFPVTLKGDRRTAE